MSSLDRIVPTISTGEETLNFKDKSLDVYNKKRPDKLPGRFHVEKFLITCV